MCDFKSILVHADSQPGCGIRLQVAHRLAEQFDAAVTAGYATSPGVLEVPTGFSAGADVAAMMLQLDTDRRARARSLFEHARANGLPRLAWADLPGEPVQAFGRAAMYADLAVVGQPDPRVAAADVPPDFVESMTIFSGAPVLVVPYIGVSSTIGRSVLLAWKESRESAHALWAAMPLLQAADRVHVVMWDGPDASAAEESPRIDARLQRQGVRAQLHRCGRESRDIGEQMLSLAAEFSSDLLVMGCYGHSRSREWVLGGATRSVLRSMTLPVLLAH
jgi:nucleotide-binding universal stress UspA family protein